MTFFVFVSGEPILTPELLTSANVTPIDQVTRYVIDFCADLIVLDPL